MDLMQPRKTLYTILGLQPDATPEAIKKAWHKTAAKHHPDRLDGDRDQFEEAHHAYLVLKNPELREEYDRTGVDPGVRVDNEQAIVLQNLHRLLQKYIAMGEIASSKDLVKCIVDDLNQEDRQDTATIAQLDLNIALIQKIQKRFRTRNKKSIGPNLLVMACQGQINQLEDGKKNPQDNIAFRKKIRECLANYEFEVAPMLASAITSAYNPYQNQSRGTW